LHSVLDPCRIDADVAALVAGHPLATLVTPVGDTIHVSHLPLLLSAQPGERAVIVGHLSRANPHTEALAAGAPSVAVFHGPQAYLSSSWYGERDMAPTWCYVAVHAHGRPSLSPDDGHTLRCVRALVEHLERGRPGEWRMAELGGAGIARRVPRIVGFEITVARAEKRWMLGEGERPSDLAAAIEHLRTSQPELVALIAAAHGLPSPSTDGRSSGP
jgi:transcriptional regulator